MIRIVEVCYQFTSSIIEHASVMVYATDFEFSRCGACIAFIISGQIDHIFGQTRQTLADRITVTCG